MAVAFVGHSIQLHERTVKTGFTGLLCKVGVLSETDSVGGDMHPLKTQCSGRPDCIQEKWRDRRLAAREQDVYFPLRLERPGTLQDALDIVEIKLVDVTDSIGVHKTRPALHVATIRQIEYQESTAAVASTSSKGPWIWQVLRMRTRPASSIISALMTPGSSLRTLMPVRPSSTALRVSITQSGPTERVVRGTPRGIAERDGRSDRLPGTHDGAR